jgi:predicted amidohydrolase
MKAGLFQFNPSFGKKEENFRKVVSVLSDTDLQLLVLPEFFATGYQFTSADEVSGLSESIPGGETTDTLLEISRDRGMYIVAGLPERDGERFYNSAIFTGPEGFIGAYRKTHLFYEEKLYFATGDSGFRVWDTDLGRIGIMICFDWFFPESMRTLALLGADVVAHPSNLVLPYCPDSMPVRCRENRVFAVTANRTGTEERKEGDPLRFIGQSLIMSPGGEPLARASGDEEVLLVADIDPLLARDKSINPYNDVMRDRMPGRYGQLCVHEDPSGQ